MDDRKFNIQNINLIFPKNKFTALIGPSGGGKTTIVDLLLKIYDIKMGKFSYNVSLLDIKSESGSEKFPMLVKIPSSLIQA